jgi:hypothetical protein
MKNKDNVRLNVVELDRFRDRLARILLGLIGLRHVTFISRSEPFLTVKD